MKRDRIRKNDMADISSSSWSLSRSRLPRRATKLSRWYHSMSIITLVVMTFHYRACKTLTTRTATSSSTVATTGATTKTIDRIASPPIQDDRSSSSSPSSSSSSFYHSRLAKKPLYVLYTPLGDETSTTNRSLRKEWPASVQLPSSTSTSMTPSTPGGRKTAPPDFGTIEFRSLYKHGNKTTTIKTSGMIPTQQQEQQQHQQQLLDQYQNHQQRLIRRDDYQHFEVTREELLETWDDEEYSDQFEFRENRQDEVEECQDPSWVDDYYATCNTVHEVALLDRHVATDASSSSSSLQDYNIKYLSAGGLRRAWRVYRPRLTIASDDNNDHETKNGPMMMSDMVMKLYSPSRGDRLQKDLHRVRLETLIMERTSSSPYILDVYGSCGITMFVETMDTNVEDLAIPSEEGVMDQKELDKLSDHWPHRQSQNNLTASEKLYIAMSMAHGLYDLHTYKGGQILHADVATEQWLVSKAGHVKLNDFNYAEIMTWNVLDGGYCPNQIKYSGFVRSPEELMGLPSDSSKDIYSFGHVMYGLLTGLLYVRKGCLHGSVSVCTLVIPVTTLDLARHLTHFCLPRCSHDFVRPYYDEQYHGKDKYDLKSLIVKGKHPHVDKRYLDRSSGVGYIDFRLASIIIDCWRLDPRQRPSIGTILKFLQDTMIEANNHGYLEPSGRIQAPPLPHKATGTEMTSTNNRNTFGGVPTDGGSNTTST